MRIESSAAEPVDGGHRPFSPPSHFFKRDSAQIHQPGENSSEWMRLWLAGRRVRRAEDHVTHLGMGSEQLIVNEVGR